MGYNSFFLRSFANSIKGNAQSFRPYPIQSAKQQRTHYIYNMKKILFAACILLICCLSHTKAQTQMSMATIDTTLAKPAQPALPIYGMLRYDSILQSMPEYAAMKIRVKQLRDKYEREANYNELNFKRMFTDFMQGQKDFPQNILLKRQRDLQDALEKGLAFRHQADSLVRAAEADMLAPIRLMLDDAIAAVGEERNYQYIINRDSKAMPYVRRSLSEDATPYVLAKLNTLR